MGRPLRDHRRATGLLHWCIVAGLRLLDHQRAAAWRPWAATSSDHHIIAGRAGYDTKSVAAIPVEHHKAKEFATQPD